MGEVRNTLTRPSVKMDLLQEAELLRTKFQGKKFEELTAAEQYQCNADYDNLVLARIANSEMIKDMTRLVEIFTSKGEARRKDRETMAAAIEILEEMTRPPKEEKPVEKPKEEKPVEQPKEEKPVEIPKEEKPIEPPKEEKPVEAPKVEVPKEEKPKGKNG